MMTKTQKLTLLVLSLILLIILGSLIWLWHTQPQTLYLSPLESLSQAELLESRQIIATRLAELDAHSQVQIDGQGLQISHSPKLDSKQLLPLISPRGEVEIIIGGTEFPIPEHPDDAEAIETAAEGNPDANVYQRLLSQADFVSAWAGLDVFSLTIQLNEAAVDRYLEQTRAASGLYICVAVDKYVLGCPIFRLTGQSLNLQQGPTDMRITAENLARFINSGVLTSAFR